MFGNEHVRIREILLDLRLKVYYIDRQTIMKVNKVVYLLFFDIIDIGVKYANKEK